MMIETIRFLAGGIAILGLTGLGILLAILMYKLIQMVIYSGEWR